MKRVRFAVVLIRRYLSGATQFHGMKTKLVSLCVVMIALAGCSTVESRVSNNRAAFDSWPPAVQQKVTAGQIDVGFSTDQVRMALGDPDYVFARSAVTGNFEVWSYRDRGPRFSFGLGMGSFSGRSGYSTGIGVNTGGGYPDEKMRVIFDHTGRVSSIEEVRKAR